VEILTSKAQHVQPEWINFVSTAKAKGKIQAQLRRDEKVVRGAGEDMLRQWFKEHDTEMTTSLVDKLCDILEVHKHEQLYLGIGRKSFTLDDELYKRLTSRKKKTVDMAGWRKFVPFIKADKKKAVKQEEKFIVTDKFDKKKPIYLTEGTIGKYIFPDCCHAIPGDDILGYIDDKNRIKIHRRDCPVAVRLKSSYGNRIVDAKWKMHNLMFFDAGISAKGIDRVGLLKDVTQILSDELKLNIKNVNIHCENELFEAHFDIRVHNREEVQDIIKKLRAVQGIEEISMD
ncbi:MAG: GTP pyrophosphokinase, partial [Prevotella sp.]|nr:GTP pyrophosphokinase [Prevotella sp.]